MGREDETVKSDASPQPCGLCGQPVCGHASVMVDGRTVALCHADSGPDCYRLWTVYDYRPSPRVRRWLNDWRAGQRP